MSGNKNYSDLRSLALGHLSHEEVAHKHLQMNGSHAELTSVLRGGHDRIQHLLQTGGSGNTEELQAKLDTVQSNATSMEENIVELNRRLAEAQAKIASQETELTSALSSVAVEKQRADDLQERITYIEQHYDLSDVEEGDDEDGVEEAEKTSETTARVGYMPSRSELKDIATQNGFRVRAQSGGKEDLNDYVYVTMEKAVEYAHSKS